MSEPGVVGIIHANGSPMIAVNKITIIGLIQTLVIFIGFYG